MARVVIYADEQEPSDDPVQHAMRYEPGMVVAILPDGADPWPKGPPRRQYHVIDFPRVSVDTLSGLIAGDLPPVRATPLLLPARDVLRRRARKLDMAALTATLADPVKGAEVRTNPVRARLHLLAAMKDIPKPPEIGSIVKKNAG